MPGGENRERERKPGMTTHGLTGGSRPVQLGEHPIVVLDFRHDPVDVAGRARARRLRFRRVIDCCTVIASHELVLVTGPASRRERERERKRERHRDRERERREGALTR